MLLFCLNPVLLYANLAHQFDLTMYIFKVCLFFACVCERETGTPPGSSCHNSCQAQLATVRSTPAWVGVGSRM